MDDKNTIQKQYSAYSTVYNTNYFKENQSYF
jgi:hypothetical protein